MYIVFTPPFFLKFTPAVLLLTCDFDFLHNLAGSIVDFHADSDWLSVVINLNLRKIYY